MHLELTDAQTEALMRELSKIIDGDRYPLSPRIRVLKEILGMLRPEPVCEPLPPATALRTTEQGEILAATRVAGARSDIEQDGRTAREREGSAALERSGLAFFGERPGGLLEVLGEIELQGGGLHCNLALELIHIPAAAADGCAHREWRVLRHFRGELVGDFEVPAFRRDAVDDAGCESLFGGEEAAGQGHLSRKGGGAAEIQLG